MPKRRTFFETVRTGKDHVAFKKIFFALSRQSGCPLLATNKYYNLLVKGIKDEGAGYIKKLAAFPIYGLRVLGNDYPSKSSYGLKVRSRTGFPYMFAWYFQELTKLSQLEPTSANVLKIRRILTVLSIGKMLKVYSPRRIKKERLAYAESSVKHLDFQRIAAYRERYTEEILAFLRFLRYRPRDISRFRDEYGVTQIEGRVGLDPGCFSMKSLAKRTLNNSILNEIPEAVSTVLLNRSMIDVTKGTLNRATALARRTVPDGKQTIIPEYGGKFRGITSYFSPLIHASTVYGSVRSALEGWGPDCSLDQQVGHERIRKLTLEVGKLLPIVSADASNFTDSIEINLMYVMLECMREAGFLEYISTISIATENGIITTSLPLMGIKGCFELGCLMLGFALYRESKKSYGLRRRKHLMLRGSAHCCDDFSSRATLAAVESAYQFIGCSLNYNKTVVSHTVAVFCGEMFWKGHTVTPVRLKLTTLFDSSDGTAVLPMIRSFLDRCRPVYSSSTMRCVEDYLMEASIRSVGKHNVSFQLPTKLGGVPIPRKFGASLLEVLSKRRNVLYALYNTPIEQEEPDTISRMIGYVRLGKPVKQPDGTILPAVNLPTTGKRGWLRRKMFVKDSYERGSLSVLDVLEYYYS